MLYLKLWIEGEEEGLSGAIKAIADLKGLGCQCTKHLKLLKNKKNKKHNNNKKKVISTITMCH